MTKVLLSIKPTFVNRIFDGKKKYEYRKTIFCHQNISTVIVYASAPIQRVIGEFTIEKIITDSVSNIWKQTYRSSGISKDFYLSYFKGKKTAYAIKIKKTKKYAKMRTLASYHIKHAPQSFVYITEQKQVKTVKRGKSKKIKPRFDSKTFHTF